MARAKSGGKSNRTSKETNGVNNPASVPEVAAAAAPVSTEPENIQPQSKVTPEPKKFELLKTESRKNVVPINLEDEIRRRAYELYQRRDPATGSQAEDWLNAEREVMQRYHQSA
jgi:hypothetical protein